MLLVGLAAALMMRVNWEDDLRAQRAKKDAAQAAVEQCLKSDAATKYRGSDTPELEQEILRDCQAELDGWVNAMSAGLPASASAEALAWVKPMFPALAREVIQEQARLNRGGGRKPDPPGPIAKRAPQPEVAREVSAPAASSAPATPAGTCIRVLTDPSQSNC